MLWQNELHHNITTIEELSKYYHFTEDEKNKLNRLLEQFLCPSLAIIYL